MTITQVLAQDNKGQPTAVPPPPPQQYPAAPSSAAAPLNPTVSATTSQAQQRAAANRQARYQTAAAATVTQVAPDWRSALNQPGTHHMVAPQSVMPGQPVFMGPTPAPAASWDGGAGAALVMQALQQQGLTMQQFSEMSEEQRQQFFQFMNIIPPPPAVSPAPSHTSGEFIHIPDPSGWGDHDSHMRDS